MFKKLKKFFYLYILRKKYYRVGSCNACGRCCQKIYVKHKNVIQTEEEFKKLHKETNKCKIHKKRPGICRRYPQEELFMMGGTLAENCGYRLEPIESFEEVFE